MPKKIRQSALDLETSIEQALKEAEELLKLNPKPEDVYNLLKTKFEEYKFQQLKETNKQFESYLICPNCSSHNLRTEKRLNGDSTCLDCGHHNKTGTFLLRKK